ncbi:hypothetical protein HZA99_00640 [Candidatus Woesearchaeota archaeon]|nr:hypothetical protein [Candidatus Woesearchaeota archaeon]
MNKGNCINRIDEIISLVYRLGWRPELNNVIDKIGDLAADGPYEDVYGGYLFLFYERFVEKDPIKAYEIAKQSAYPDFLDLITSLIVINTLRGDTLESTCLKSGGIEINNLERTIIDIYLNPIKMLSPQQQVAAPPPSPVHSSSFSIESLAGKYRVHGVSYQGKICTVDISTALLDYGTSHTQSDWIEMTKEGEWKLPSGPLYFAVLETIYSNKKSSDTTQKALVQELRKMFERDLRRYSIMTSTCIRYAHDGLDTIVHDVGYATECTEKTNIVKSKERNLEFPHNYNYNKGWGSHFSRNLQALVGTNNYNKVEKVGKWITGRKKADLWLLNPNPSKDVECPLTLSGLNYGQFLISGVDARKKRAHGMVVHSAENYS